MFKHKRGGRGLDSAGTTLQASMLRDIEIEIFLFQYHGDVMLRDIFRRLFV